MFTDTVAFHHKATIFKHIVDSPLFSALPSHREAQIQIAKLIRATKALDKKFPVEMMLSVPQKKFYKMRGVERQKA